jgi:uncharacterized protein involved in exopolysaccharide biosynthesis
MTASDRVAELLRRQDQIRHELAAVEAEALRVRARMARLDLEIAVARSQERAETEQHHA